MYCWFCYEYVIVTKIKLAEKKTEMFWNNVLFVKLHFG